MLAPFSASTRVARRKNFSVRSICLPTATTPSVGMPRRSPALAVRLRSSRERDSPGAPMKVCTAMQSASMRAALSTSQAMPPPLDISSKSTVVS